MELMELYSYSLKVGLAVGISLFSLEAIYSLVKKDQVYSPKEFLANLGTVMVYQGTRKFIFTSLTLFMLAICYQFRITNMGYGLASWIACFLAIDFFYYWDHRLGHEINLLWSFHNIHHSSEEFNLSIASRLSWIENIYRWIFLAPIALMGFPVEMIITLKLFHRFYQVLIHTQYIGKMGPFELAFVTPSQHRVHHGRNKQYLDKNYGGTLNVWDRMFKTFEKEEEKVEYGLVKQIKTSNIFKILATT